MKTKGFSSLKATGAIVLGFAVVALLFSVTFNTSRTSANSANLGGTVTLSEGFDDIATLPTGGWVQSNQSTTVGTTGWSQGTTETFPSQGGNPTAYISANFNNAASGTISNWLVTPVLTMNNGDVLKFWTRTVTPGATIFPDRLEVRMSEGSGSDTGTGPTGVGTFTTVLTTINPNLDTTSYPIVWTEFTLTISGLASETPGRIAFRYHVTDAGPTGNNSNFIGIDTVSYTSFGGGPTPTPTPTPTPLPPGTIQEGFETVMPAGWSQVNKSEPLGASTWSQCGGASIPPAHQGTPNSCALVNFNSTTGAGTISNWMFAPTVTLNNGDTVSFYTRTPNNNFPDRLQLRMSTNGASTDVGTTALDVGDFTTVLVDIDPTYSGSYPLVWTEFTATISGLSGPTSGRLAFRYFVEDGGPNGTRSNIIGVDTFTYIPNTSTPSSGNGRADFDGDGATDISVFRGSEGNWYIAGSTDGFIAGNFGLASDTLIPADYDGDGKADLAVYRPSANDAEADFYILNSGTSTLSGLSWGLPGDVPAVGNYDSDANADVAVFRPSDGLWYILSSANGLQLVSLGTATSTVTVGDFDGDGITDPGVFENGNWNVILSGGGVIASTFGIAGDVPAVGDYDGDSKSDLAVFRAGTWHILNSGDGTTSAIPFGLATDVPVPGDYDGDGSDDVAVYRDGQWWINGSTSGILSVNFGLATDAPVPASANP